MKHLKQESGDTPSFMKGFLEAFIPLPYIFQRHMIIHTEYFDKIAREKLGENVTWIKLDRVSTLPGLALVHSLLRRRR